MAKQKKSPAQLLGLQRMPLTIKSCKERSVFLRNRVESNYYKGETRSLAMRWASWYKAKAKMLRGGK